MANGKALKAVAHEIIQVSDRDAGRVIARNAPQTDAIPTSAIGGTGGGVAISAKSLLIIISSNI